MIGTKVVPQVVQDEDAFTIRTVEATIHQYNTLIADLRQQIRVLQDASVRLVSGHLKATRERERWHGKYMMVKSENNKLRAKLYQQQKKEKAEAK